MRDLIDWNSAEMSPHIRDRLEQAISDPDFDGSKLKPMVKTPAKRDENAEPEGIIQDPKDFHNDYHASSVILVKDIGAHLVKHYPGWHWVVQLNEKGHMIELLNLHCHPSMGYRIRMEDIMNDPHRTAAKVGAGELLERYGMARKGLNSENLSRLATAPRDAAGNLIPEISDLPDKKRATQAEVARGLATGKYRIFEVNGQKFLRIKK